MSDPPARSSCSDVPRPGEPPGDEHEPLQKHVATAPANSTKDAANATGSSRIPAPFKDAKTEQHDPGLGDWEDGLSQQHADLPAHNEDSASESQLPPASSVTMTRSPKRSSFSDASQSLPSPKRHERERPSGEDEPSPKPTMALSTHGSDALALEGSSPILDSLTISGLQDTTATKHPPDLGDREEEPLLKQRVDLPPHGEDNAAESQPALTPKLSPVPHLPPPTVQTLTGISDEEKAVAGEPKISSPLAQSAVRHAAIDHGSPRRELTLISYKKLNEFETTAINEVWSRLRSSIHVFTGVVLPHHCSWNDLPGSYRNEIGTWASNPQGHFERKTMCGARTLLAADLFRLLHHHLFSGEDSDKWNGEEWQAFGRIQASAKAHIREPNDLFAVKYHHWRNLSAQTLGELLPQQRHVDPDWLRAKIETWVRGLPPPLDVWAKTITGEWERLIESAINMDSLMIVARRDIRMQLIDPDTKKSHGFPLGNKKKMTTMNAPSKEAPTVDFVVFPSLLVYGKTDGVFYGPTFDPAGSVLRPFGFSWDIVSKEVPMKVICDPRVHKSLKLCD